MRRSLEGLRVLNTRPNEQASTLSQTIRDAGGLVIELPTLEIHPTYKWLNFLPDLKTVNQAIFISINAVNHCFKLLKQHHITWPSSIKVIALGKGTATALNQFNIQVHAIPEVADSEHLLALPLLKEPKKQHILLFKGEGGRRLIEDKLLEKGAHLLTLNAYTRDFPKINPQFVASIWRDDAVDIILLTSEQSMHHLFMLFEKEAHTWLRSKTYLVISERLAEAAIVAGIKKIIRSHPDQMMDALFDALT